MCLNSVNTQPLLHSQDQVPTLYKCDPTSFKCIACDPRDVCEKLAVCTETCQKASPLELVGSWRGLIIKDGPKNEFDFGEEDIVFGKTDASFRSADGIVTKYTVQ